VLIHGYPLSGRAWDKQLLCCWRPATGSSTYEPGAGSGKSSQPASGYDYDTLRPPTSMPCWNNLDLRDAVLGRATPWAPARSPSTWAATGSARVAKAVLVSTPIPP